MAFGRRRLRAAVLAVAALVAPAASAASASVRAADDRISPVGASPLARVAADIERAGEEIEATGQTVGFAIVVVGGGELLLARGYGRTIAGGGDAVNADTVFRFASLSKSFAATLMALLAEQGYFSLDSRVQDLVPALALSDSRQASLLTVRDLLSHRVGLPYNALDRELERDEPYPLLVYRLRELPMLCRVGDCYAYQNIAFSLTGDVAFATVGDFYAYQVERRLFHPLGMTSATFGRDALEASAGGWARPHVRRGGRWEAVRPKETYYRVLPAAGINASVRDLGIWLNAQLGHRPDVLPPALLATIHTDTVHTPSERLVSAWRRERVRDAHYALGWRSFDYAGQRVLFHGGAVQGYRAVMALVPGHDAGIGVLWNSESALPSGLLPTFLDALFGQPAHDWLGLDRQSPRTAATRRATPAASGGQGAGSE